MSTTTVSMSSTLTATRPSGVQAEGATTSVTFDFSIDPGFALGVASAALTVQMKGDFGTDQPEWYPTIWLGGMLLGNCSGKVQLCADVADTCLSRVDVLHHVQASGSLTAAFSLNSPDPSYSWDCPTVALFELSLVYNYPPMPLLPPSPPTSPPCSPPPPHAPPPPFPPPLPPRPPLLPGAQLISSTEELRAQFHEAPRRSCVLLILPPGRLELAGSELWLTGGNVTLVGAADGSSVLDAAGKSRVLHVTQGTLLLTGIGLIGGQNLTGVASSSFSFDGALQGNAPGGALLVDGLLATVSIEGGSGVSSSQADVGGGGVHSPLLVEQQAPFLLLPPCTLNAKIQTCPVGMPSSASHNDPMSRSRK